MKRPIKLIDMWERYSVHALFLTIQPNEIDVERKVISPILRSLPARIIEDELYVCFGFPNNRLIGFTADQVLFDNLPSVTVHP